MSSTIEDDHSFHETIMLSTKLIVESQEAMLCKMNEASSASLEHAVVMESLLSKLIETQAQKQHQLLEMLTTRGSFKKECDVQVQNHNQNLLTDINNITKAGVSSEAVDSLIVILNNNQSSVLLDVDDETKQIVVESSDLEVEDGHEEDVREAPEILEDVLRPSNTTNYDYAGYEPLIEAVKNRDWDKATEYVKINQTTIKEMFKTRDLKKEFREMIDAATVQPIRWKFLKEIVKVVTPDTLKYIIPHQDRTVLQVAVKYGKIEHVKMLVEKNPKLIQMRRGLGIAHLPLSIALIWVHGDAQKELVEYLYPVTRDNVGLVNGDEDPNPFTGPKGSDMLCTIIETNFCVYSIVQERVKEWNIFRLVERMANKPFAFLTGAKLTWWERCIYSRIEVDIDHPHDHAIKGKHLESSKYTINRDEENPSGTSKDSSTSNDKESTRQYIAVRFKRCLMLVPCIRHIYEQKLAHKQAVALVKSLVTRLNEKLEGMSQDKQLREFQKRRLMERAIKYGTTEFILECLQVFPFLHRFDILKEQSLFKLAIEERNEKVFNFICEQREKEQITFAVMPTMGLFDCCTSILHYAAELPSIRRLNFVPCEAFQMQREMQWSKGVESYLKQQHRFIRNKDGNTAYDVFVEKHKDLMEKGEKWMKDTSGSCMLVGALVATVAFAAAFTVPGGNISDNNSQDNGIPVFVKEKSFMVFAIADALSLFSSIASVLMFLAVYTSRYSAEDFLISLPQKLILGLGTLCVSMASILVSFSAAFTIILGNRFAWAPTIVGLFGCVPVFLFGFLQFPLFVQMVYSTYWPIRFWKPKIVKKESRFASWKKSVRLMLKQCKLI
ncbi:hypothetical protein MKX03_031208 [Papaver bracteatum]|nr:hypothetical protein MKX03_031208 [Papaver bracteatum]